MTGELVGITTMLVVITVTVAGLATLRSWICFSKDLMAANDSAATELVATGTFATAGVVNAEAIDWRLSQQASRTNITRPAATNRFQFFFHQGGEVGTRGVGGTTGGVGGVGVGGTGGTGVGAVRRRAGRRLVTFVVRVVVLVTTAGAIGGAGGALFGGAAGAVFAVTVAFGAVAFFFAEGGKGAGPLLAGVANGAGDFLGFISYYML